MEFSKSKTTDFIRKRIREMDAYVPGKQTSDPGVIKLNTNENPFPVTDRVKKALVDEIERGEIQKYPDPVSSKLRAALAKKFGTDESRIMIGNGSDEILSIVFRSTLDKGDIVVYSRPSYSLYPVLAKLAGADAAEVEVNSDWTHDLEGMQRFASGTTPMGFFTPGARLTVIANPNAPTGLAETKSSLLNYVIRNVGLTLVDEAYAEFGAESLADVAGTERYPRLMVCGTFSKSHSLAGQRIGWLIAHPDLIREFDKVRDSYNVSRLSQVAALAALEDEPEIKSRLEEIKKNRDYLIQELRGLGFYCLDSSANFVYAKPPANVSKNQFQDNAASLFTEFMEKNNILIRHFGGNPRTVDYVRVSVGKREHLELFLEKTREWLNMWKTV
jgi:histidinol-phosphate aminotransferase